MGRRQQTTAASCISELRKEIIEEIVRRMDWS
jgi:hypothetical protein